MASPTAVVVRPHSMEDLCMVAPPPELRAQFVQRYNELKESSPDCPELSVLQSALHPMSTKRPGLNDAKVRPAGMADFGPAISEGNINVIVVMVDFPDRKFTETETKDYFKRLWFKKGAPNGNSVRDYFQEVSHGKVRVKGEVVGPFTMSKHSAEYGGDALKAQVMAKEAAILAVQAKVDFSKYIHANDEYVDAYVIVHAGPGAESTPHDVAINIWSHKFTLEHELPAGDKAVIYPYLTVPGDCKLGLCAHELGHLAFRWPDLYDTDASSQGIGDWCLMASGSWNDSGDNPAAPCAWCKIQMKWVKVTTPTKPKQFNLSDVKDEPHEVLKLWKDGKPESEYFLVENRQRKGRDSHIPSGGLLLWHIDDTQYTNEDENRFKVALVQSDGERDLNRKQNWEFHPEDNRTGNQGDSGDPFPGRENKHTHVDDNSKPSNTRTHSGAPSGVAIRNISVPGDVMTFSVIV